jgi:hypothetical protein
MYEIYQLSNEYSREYQRERIREAEAYRLAQHAQVSNGWVKIMSVIRDASSAFARQPKVRSASRSAARL